MGRMGRGWKAVQVGDELLLGASEGGFFGLEEFEPEPGAVDALLAGAEGAPPSAPAARPGKKAARGPQAAKQGAQQGAQQGGQGEGRKRKGKQEEAAAAPAARSPKRAKRAGGAQGPGAAGAGSQQAQQGAQQGAGATPPVQAEAGAGTPAPHAQPGGQGPGAAEGDAAQAKPPSRKERRAAHRAEVWQALKAKKAARKARWQRKGPSKGAPPGGAAPAAEGPGESEDQEAAAAAAVEGSPEGEGPQGVGADGKGPPQAAAAGAVLGALSNDDDDEDAAPPSLEGAPSGDEDAPVEGMGAWEGLGLSSAVLRPLKALGFVQPTAIQRACIPPAVQGRRDIIGAAQTGSGKTLAFGLPILQLLLQQREQEAAQLEVDGDEDPSMGSPIPEGATPGPKGGGLLRALILAPARELAIQVAEHLAAVARPNGLWVVPIVGGISQAKQTRLLGRRPAVVVATPGRLWDLMAGGDPHLGDLSGLRFLVLDEADRMVQQGRYQELTNILESLAGQRAALAAQRGPSGDGPGAGEGLEEEPPEKAGPRGKKGRAGPGAKGPKGAKGKPQGEAAPRGVLGKAPLLQSFVFSATLTLPESLRGRLRKGGGGASGSSTLEALMDRIQFRRKPAVLDLTAQRALADRVTEAVIECGNEERDEALYALLSAHPARTLVFVNAVSAARRLVALLKLLRVPAAALHASMQQRARLKALDRFKGDPRGVLVASDVAARGLDVLDVRCVVHYQVPASADGYVHRSGRTARGSAEGLSVALVTPADAPRYAALLLALRQARPPAFPLSPVMLRCARRRMQLAVRLDAAQRTSQKQAVDQAWRTRSAEAAGVDLSGDEGEGGEGRAKGAPNPQAAALAQELAEVLAEPMQAGFSQRYFTGVPSVALAAAAKPPKGAAPPAGDSQGAATGVALAQQALQRRQQMEAATQKKGSKASQKGELQQQQGGKGGKGSGRAKTLAQASAEALRAALQRRGEKRQRQRVVAVPRSYVSQPQAGAQDALSALRAKLAREAAG